MTQSAGRTPEAWPRLMNASVAAAYCGERSVGAFRRGVGALWPRPKLIPKKGERWLREDLDKAIDDLTYRPLTDAAEVL